MRRAKVQASKINTNILNNLFREGIYLKNPPNIPDLAYPIENIWGLEPKSLNK